MIRTALQPSLIGEVRLELNDGTVETYDDGSDRIRAVPEFQAFCDAIKAKDLDFCYQVLEKTLGTAAVLTQARAQAGIYFPCDKR